MRNYVIVPLTWLAMARTLVSGTKDCCSQSSDDDDDIGSGYDAKRSWQGRGGGTNPWV